MAAKSRHLLREREAKELLSTFTARLGIDLQEVLGREPKIEKLDFPKSTLLIISERPLLFRAGGETLPTLLFDELLARLPRVTVDMGAVPHVCNGADVMSPGVVRVDGSFEKGSLVVIADEKHGRYLALGESLVNSDDLRKRGHGKVVRNIHYVGDHVWNAAKSLR
jgi:PUA domain protein